MDEHKALKSRKERIKDYIEHEGISKFLTNIAIGIIVVLALGNLALSQIHIGVITQIFERLSGLVMFLFILFGLVTLFLTTRMKDRKSGVYRAMGSIVFTIGLGCLFSYYLYHDVVTQPSVTFQTVGTSLIFSIILVVFYLTALILLIIAQAKHDKQ
jgi:succinate dehydrogenase hydrophobic anchor subunit